MFVLRALRSCLLAMATMAKSLQVIPVICAALRSGRYVIYVCCLITTHHALWVAPQESCPCHSPLVVIASICCVWSVVYALWFVRTRMLLTSAAYCGRLWATWHCAWPQRSRWHGPSVGKEKGCNLFSCSLPHTYAHSLLPTCRFRSPSPQVSA